MAGGRTYSVTEKIDYLLSQGYTKKRVRSGRGFRTIVRSPSGEIVASPSEEWKTVRNRIASREYARKKGTQQRKPLGELSEADAAKRRTAQNIRDKRRWRIESHNTKLNRVSGIVESWPEGKKFDWQGKNYTKKGLIRHINKLGTEGLEELVEIDKQVRGVGSSSVKTLTGKRRGTPLGEFEANKLRLNKLIDEAGLTTGRGFQMGHGVSKFRFPELKNIPSNLALETASEGAAKQAGATARDLYESSRRMEKGLGPAHSRMSRSDLNRLSGLIYERGKMTPELESLINYFKKLPSVRTYKSGDRPVITRGGEEVMTTADPETGRAKLVPKPGHARSIMNLLRNVKSFGGVAALPPAILASMLYPDRADAIMKYTSAAIDPIGSLLFPYGEGYSKGTPGGASGWQQSLIDPTHGGGLRR
tara:strand:- start:40 stop:1296 length:1257 start_codon:yes stop_codon:yes gene_type:complete